MTDCLHCQNPATYTVLGCTGYAPSGFQLSDLPEQIARRVHVHPVTSCWQYEDPYGNLSPDRYRRIEWDGKYQFAHRLIYEMLVGPIAPRLVIDHVFARGCRFNACIWPDHLEAVTLAENARRCALANRLQGPSQRMWERYSAATGAPLYPGDLGWLLWPHPLVEMLDPAFQRKARARLKRQQKRKAA